MLSFGFSTLAEIKRRLDISPDDLSTDTLLQDILHLTAGSIENEAGRALRRVHAVTEFFTGGNRTIRTSSAPIAQIHSIRESSIRDFSDSDNYTELVQGTDYVLDDDGQVPGKSGVIRRLDTKWSGSVSSPGEIQVVYTGGFISDEEVALSNGTTIINSSNEIQDSGIQRLEASLDEFFYSIVSPSSGVIQFFEFGSFPADDIHSRAIVEFSTKNIILPSWDIVSLEAEFGLRGSTAASHVISAYLLPGPLVLGGSELSDLYDATGGTLVHSFTIASNVLSVQNFSFSDPLVAAARELFNDTLVDGHISFVFKKTVLDNIISELATIENTANSLHPTLTITHRNPAINSFPVPSDLRNANLIQTAYEFQQRKQPGLISKGTKGKFASGFFEMKTLATLLPEVQQIAARYQRPY